MKIKTLNILEKDIFIDDIVNYSASFQVNIEFYENETKLIKNETIQEVEENSSSESNSSSENESNGSQSRNTESKKDSNKIEVNISINKSSSFKKIPIAAKPISNKVFPEIRNSKKGLPEISAANRFQFKSPGLSSTSLNEVSSASYPNSNLGAINQNLISFGNKMNQLNNMPILSSLQKRCDTDNSIKIDGDNKKESYEPERNNNKRNTLNYSKRNSFLILSNKFNKMMGAKNK